MNAIPYIVVQLVHIGGPLKGEIQEFTADPILIGRHPDCHVQFPKDVVTLSRRHAKIIREGNRFKLIDQSTNGSFVNGQQVSEAYLKDGDVITFSEGGPKVSFLTQVSDQPPSQPQTPPAPRMPEPKMAPPVPPQPVAQPSPPPVAQPISPPRPGRPQTPAEPQPAFQHPPAAAEAPSGPAVRNVKVPFAIQFGPTLKSFQSLPITLGKGAGCDFVLNHPALADQQVQIFFSQEQYWIKDLTGASAVLINGMPIAGQSPLQPDMQISLSPQGPKFRFLGGGRLVEVEDPLPDTPAPPPQPGPDTAKASGKSDAPANKVGTLFKRFFS